MPLYFSCIFQAVKEPNSLSVFLFDIIFKLIRIFIFQCILLSLYALSKTKSAGRHLLLEITLFLLREFTGLTFHKANSSLVFLTTDTYLNCDIE